MQLRDGSDAGEPERDGRTGRAKAAVEADDGESTETDADETDGGTDDGRIRIADAVVLRVRSGV